MYLLKKIVPPLIAVIFVVLTLVVTTYLQKKHVKDTNTLPALSDEFLRSLDSNKDPTMNGLYSETKPRTGFEVTENDTYTKKYLAVLPEDIKREEILASERIEAFINVYSEELLPPVSIDEKYVLESNSDEALTAYLDNISPNHNPSLHAISSDDIDQAFADHLNADSEKMTTLVRNIQTNIQVLQNVSVPNQFIDLHKKNIAAHQSLLRNVLLLQNVHDDFIGALMGTHSITKLGTVFQEIATEINQERNKG